MINCKENYKSYIKAMKFKTGSEVFDIMIEIDRLYEFDYIKI